MGNTGTQIQRFGICFSTMTFPVVEYSNLSHGTTILLNTLLDLLGWQHAVVGKKATPLWISDVSIGR